MDNEEVRVTSDGFKPAAEEAAAIRMSRADALSVLANLARKRDTTLEEVVALQVAVRSVAKRMFDRERHLKRKYGPKEAAEAKKEAETPSLSPDEVVRNDDAWQKEYEAAPSSTAKPVAAAVAVVCVLLALPGILMALLGWMAGGVQCP